jgi:hypothetical protein
MVVKIVSSNHLGSFQQCGKKIDGWTDGSNMFIAAYIMVTVLPHTQPLERFPKAIYDDWLLTQTFWLPFKMHLGWFGHYSEQHTK